MKFGVVGLGFMGSAHLAAWPNVAEAELAAVVSADPKKLAGDLSGISGNLDRGGGALDFGEAARYSSFEELLSDPSIEAVDLCTPSYLHADQAVRALEAGKHVLVEKPMALSADECDRMIAAARTAGRVLMVAQVLRFWPDYATARDIVRSGRIGPARHAFFRRKTGAPMWSAWMDDLSKSGGGAFDLLIHDFDFCQNLFGVPATVEAEGVEDTDRGVDVVEARLRYPGGPRVCISGGWHHPKEYPFSMEFTIVCAGGTLDFSSDLRRLTLYLGDGVSEQPELSPIDGFEAELSAFAQACRDGEAPRDCRPEDSAESVRMALAMRASREQAGRPMAP